MVLDIIGMPIYYGCDTLGADLAYDYLNNRDIESKFKKHEVINKGKIYINKNVDKHKNDKKIKYIDEIMNSSKLLYNEVSDSLENGNLPLVIGGDHSTSIGSISAVLDYYKGDVAVIWIDAHTDIHTNMTTPSGNVHGMPIAVCMGLCDERFKIGKYKLNNENIIYVGIRNYEQEEMNYIKSNNIKVFTDKDVSGIGIKGIIENISKNIKTKNIHISFDVDSFNEKEFKSVNVAEKKIYSSEGGLSINDGIYLLKYLLCNFNVSSMDIVEYNPLLDDSGDIETVEGILETIDTFLIK